MTIPLISSQPVQNATTNIVIAEATRPVVTANLSPAVREFTDRNNKGRMAPKLMSKLMIVTDTNELNAIAAVFMDLKDNETIRHEAAQILLRSNYQCMTADAVSVLNDTKETANFRSYTIQYLWQQTEKTPDAEKTKIITALNSALTDKEAAVRGEALLALARLNTIEGKETAIRWLTDSSKDLDAVRNIAIRCVYDLGLKEQLPTIRKYVSDPNPIIAKAAIVALADWNDTESLPAMIEAAKSKDVLLRRCAKTSIDRLQQKNTRP